MAIVQQDAAQTLNMLINQNCIAIRIKHHETGRTRSTCIGFIL
jgi:hypothetical protein